MKKPIAIAGLALAAVAAVVLWQVRPWSPEADTDRVVASGTVDATEVAIAFRVSGTLKSRPVGEGSPVGPGDPIAALDEREAAARVRQAEAARSTAEARLKDLLQGYRPQEIAEARAQAAQARANLENLMEEARRSEALFQGGAVSRQRRDKDLTAASVAAEQRQAAEARLRLLESGYRPGSIEAARAQLKEAQAALEAAQVALEDLEAKSTLAGVVTRTHAEVGETVGAGRPVATVTDISRPWVRVYIPENQIGKVRIGAPAVVKVDTYPEREFAGRVSYVSSEAEFTPKNVQTQEERVKLVFAVNVTLDNRDGTLKPGMPADVWIAAGDGGGR